MNDSISPSNQAVALLVTPDHPDVQQMIEQADRLMMSLYPAESCHLDPAVALQQDNVKFYGVLLEGKIVAMGAIKILHDDGDYAEVKRMFVRPEARGKGLSKIILHSLEQASRHAKVDYMRLEVGAKQPAALALYEKFGFVYRTHYGAYQADPNSLFMEKDLHA